MKLWFVFLLFTSLVPLNNAFGDSYKLQIAFPHLKFKRPIWMSHKPGDSTEFFIAEQAGIIYAFTNSPDAKKRRRFLDIRDRVSDRHNEEGLLGLAFDPRYATNGYFYVFYSASRPRRMVVSRFQTLGQYADKSSESVLLEVKQPYGNHNGGTILFGPDQKLYIGLGDGGSAGDPHNHGQNVNTLLGSILRIDVHGNPPYEIPPDNPFVDVPGRDEIWAYGLRNPWRMSFDRKTGQLWVGDVGQNKFEEINIITKGGNYGWRAREGKHDYHPTKGNQNYAEPIAEYSHLKGQSVVGGYVYRGELLSELKGHYIFADYVSGFIGAVSRDKPKKGISTLLTQPKNIASLAEDKNGELYFLAFNGRIYRLVKSEFWRIF